MTSGEIDGLLRAGAWQSVWRGVYADGGYVLDAVQRAFAATLARRGTSIAAGDDDEPGVPPVVAAGRTAARVHGLPLIDDADPATDRWEGALDDVAVRHHGRRLARTDRSGQRRELRRHHLSLAADEVVQLPNGLWATSLARTLYDGTHLLRPDAHVCMLDESLHRQLVSEDELKALASRHEKHPWSAQFLARVGQADARAESPGETLTRLLLRADLPGLVPQVELRDERSRVLARFDLADEHLRLAVEFDGKRGHSGELMVAKDRQRDALSAAHGWTTERVTWFDVRRREHSTRLRIVAVARKLQARPASA